MQQKGNGRPRGAGANGNRKPVVDLETHEEPFVTVAALAAYWCVSADTIYRDIAKGALPVYRVGSSHSIRIRLRDAQCYGRPDDSPRR